MIRRSLSVILLAAAAGFSFAQHSASPEPNPAHLDDHYKDVYAIYSMLMPGAVFANMGPAKNQQWAIADTTVSIDDMNPALAPDAALKAPPGKEQAFKEAVDSFRFLQHNRTPIIRAFQLSRPYTLLTASDAAAFRASRGNVVPDSSAEQKFASYPGITYFSDVYFDSQRSVALVYRLDWCGNICSQGEWIYLEGDRMGNQTTWHVRSGQTMIRHHAR